MPKYTVVYTSTNYASVIIEADDESHLADLMEDGDFELVWEETGFSSDVVHVQY